MIARIAGLGFFGEMIQSGELRSISLVIVPEL